MNSTLTPFVVIILTPFVVIFAAAILNRVRGGGFAASALPGRPLFYVAPAMGLLAWCVMPWQWAAAFGLGYLLWGLPAWGRWYNLNRRPREESGTPVWYEVLIEKVSGPNDYVAFTIRNTLCLIPLAAAFGGWPILIGPLQTVAYEIGWRIDKGQGTILGEYLTGALFGIALAIIDVWPNLVPYLGGFNG